MANGTHYPRKWEIVTENLQRLRVPGGWIVHNSTTVIIQNKDLRASEALLFIPDEKKEWELEH